eukprot:scaffold7052_cov254-Pinguiococcus_pyrenoidosus.AAC.46
MVILRSRRMAHRRSLRKEKGAMQLHNAKLSFYLDSETQNPKGVTAYPIRDSNRLIEEYMLIANYLVAQQLIRALPEKAVLRRHRCPDLEELAKTNENIAKTFGVTIPGDTSADMSRAIAEIQVSGLLNRGGRKEGRKEGIAFLRHRRCAGRILPGLS